MRERAIDTWEPVTGWKPKAVIGAGIALWGAILAIVWRVAQ